MVQPCTTGSARTRVPPRRCAARPWRRRGVSTGAVVCGADIEPVISAVAWSRRSEILAIWHVRRLVGLLEARLQRGDFLAEQGDRLLHRLVLFDRGHIGLGRHGRGEAAARQCADHRAERGRESHRGGEHGIASVARPQTKRGRVAGAATAIGSTAGAFRSAGDRGAAVGCNRGAFQCPAISTAIRRSAIRSLAWGLPRGAPSGFGCPWLP